MDNNQNEGNDFYTKLRAQTEEYLNDYNHFSKKLQDAKEALKFLARHIEDNNEMLTKQGLEPVKFER